MRQFIPFEDDWDALAQLSPEALIPYRVGLLRTPDTLAQRTAPTSPSTFSSSPARAPLPRGDVSASSSGT